MNVTYFNHYASIAKGRWERRRFVPQWWDVYARDRHWVPPYYPALRQALDPARNPHVARLSPIFLRLEALPRWNPPVRRDSQPQRDVFNQPLFERTVAAAVALHDPRRGDGSAHLALPHCVNDLSCLKRCQTYLLYQKDF